MKQKENSMQKLIFDAYAELVEEKNYKKIKVMEVAEKYRYKEVHFICILKI